MKKLTTMILLSAVTLGVLSCKKGVVGEGPSLTQNRPVTAFTAIDLRMAGDVYFTNDTNRKVEIIAQQNILNMLETFVAGNKLVVKFNGNSDYHSSSHIRINVSGPGINSFNVSTAGSIYCNNTIQADHLFLQSTGSGSIILQQVISGHIEAKSTTSGTIRSTGGGTTVSEDMETSGSGSIDLLGISATNVKAKTSGSGNIKVKASNQLNATVEGSGSIYFTGYPNVSSHVYGTGHLIHL